MHEFNNIRENRLGGFDADIEINGEVLPYTLTPEDIEATDLSEAVMLEKSVKDAYTAKQEQERINTDSLAYLASTDWYIVRLQETAKPIPQEILDNRQAARDAIV